jgi:hypothetical protein
MAVDLNKILFKEQFVISLIEDLLPATSYNLSF